MLKELRRRAQLIAREAQRLDRLLLVAENAEADGERVLPPVESAKLLIKLDKLAFRVEEAADAVDAALPALPIGVLRGHADGAGAGESPDGSPAA